MHAPSTTLTRRTTVAVCALLAMACITNSALAQKAVQKKGESQIVRALSIQAFQVAEKVAVAAENDAMVTYQPDGDDGDPPPPPPPGGGYDLTLPDGALTTDGDDGDPPPPPPPGGGYDRVALTDEHTDLRNGSLEQVSGVTALGNYPNPFNPTTTIRFDLAVQQQVRLTVYNTLGQAVQVLVDGTLDAGQHEARFTADRLPSGTYFMRLQTATGTVTRSMVLAK